MELVESIRQNIDGQKAAYKAAQDKKRDLMNDRNKELLTCTEQNFTNFKRDA